MPFWDLSVKHSATAALVVCKDNGPSLQFTANGHLLAFNPGSVSLSNPDAAMTTFFRGANPVTPCYLTLNNASNHKSQTIRFSDKIIYSQLWEGVTLIYEQSEFGPFKSTYHVDPGDADFVNRIRLVYNVPVHLDDDGNLILPFRTGEMRESKPVAWQEISGQRVPVEVSYAIFNEREIGFTAGNYDSRFPLIIDPELTWHTFLGSSGSDGGSDVAIDESGNVYVLGSGDATWGTPINAYAGAGDAFVAKLDPDGNPLWNTFMGSASQLDSGGRIAIDSVGNIYVSGSSDATWGTPVNAHAGGGTDGFVAKLDNNGNWLWNTFMGAAGADDLAIGIDVDGSGNVYVTGESAATWGTPVTAYAGGNFDGFTAKLNTSGVLQWNTFFGGAGANDDDGGRALVIDGSTNTYVAGYSTGNWGTPLIAHHPNVHPDVSILKLDPNGNYVWNTFLGSSSDNSASGIALDISDNVYLAGYSTGTWGSPINAYNGGQDAFYAKLDPGGNLVLNTFLGSANNDIAQDVILDAAGNVYLSGKSDTTWGTPDTPHAGGEDAFAVKLDPNGNWTWNTFMGSGNNDGGQGINLDNNANIYVSGSAGATWGTPVTAYAGGASDAFLDKFSTITKTKSFHFNRAHNVE